MKKTKIDLKESRVVFNEEEHTYHLDGKQLKGITGVITKHLFPDKYSGVPASVLSRRAAFGSDFHSDMEIYINLGIESSTDIFRVFKENYGDLKFAASEYIVTDGMDFASPIDAVGDDAVIYDFKTSTKPDLEYWKWQLTVYRYLFYLQNGYEPAGYRVLWINKDLKHKLYEIEPYPMEAAEKLLDAERNGVLFDQSEFAGDLSPMSDTRLAALYDVELCIANLETQLKEMKRKEDEMKAALIEVFAEHNVKTYDTDLLKITLKDAYTRKSVDSALLKERHPEVYDECLKESTVKASIVIKVKESKTKE